MARTSGHCAWMVTFDGGQVIDEWSTLVDPEYWFSGINIGIHGIDEDAVQGAPTMAEVGPFLGEYLYERESWRTPPT
jgi:DNA polymerase III subunit epsilon